ncbi:MAG: WD40 repeat domain-containing protein, partial [Chloroflexota bacterium]
IPLGAEMPIALAVNASTNRVFVAGANGTAVGTVSTIDASRGSVLRAVRVSSYPRMIVTASQANRAFVLSGSPDFTPRELAGMSMLDAGTGELLRTFALPGYPVAATVYEPAGRLFVVTSVFSEANHVWTPELAMRDAATGQLLRTIRLPSFISSEGVTLAADTKTARLFVTYSSLGADGDECHVSMLDAVTGAILHTISIRPAEVYSAGMIASAVTVDQTSGRVFVASYDETNSAGRLSILNAKSDGVLPTVIGSAGKIPIAIAVGEDGRLVVINGTSGAGELVKNGGVRVLDASSGKLLYTVPVGAVVPSAVAMVGHLAFLMDAGGRITLLDIRNGHIL